MDVDEPVLEDLPVESANIPNHRYLIMELEIVVAEGRQDQRVRKFLRGEAAEVPVDLLQNVKQGRIEWIFWLLRVCMAYDVSCDEEQV